MLLEFTSSKKSDTLNSYVFFIAGLTVWGELPERREQISNGRAQQAHLLSSALVA